MKQFLIILIIAVAIIVVFFWWYFSAIQEGGCFWAYQGNLNLSVTDKQDALNLCKSEFGENVITVEITTSKSLGISEYTRTTYNVTDDIFYCKSTTSPEFKEDEFAIDYNGNVFWYMCLK